MIKMLMTLPLIGRIVERIIIKREGGEMTSDLLRQITNERFKTKVGLYTYGGCFAADFNVGGKVTVGRYCSIAKDVHYFGANHPIRSVTTSALFYNKKFGYEVNDVKREELNIGNDVWIGYGVLITAGCRKIGNGAVIGAGAVVTRDVEPYEIIVGVPGKSIGKRFDVEQIVKLEQTKWYEASPEELMDYYSYFSDVDKFCECYKNG